MTTTRRKESPSRHSSKITEKSLLFRPNRQHACCRCRSSSTTLLGFLLCFCSRPVEIQSFVAPRQQRNRFHRTTYTNTPLLIQSSSSSSSRDRSSSSSSSSGSSKLEEKHLHHDDAAEKFVGFLNGLNADAEVVDLLWNNNNGTITTTTTTTSNITTSHHYSYYNQRQASLEEEEETKPRSNSNHSQSSSYPYDTGPQESIGDITNTTAETPASCVTTLPTNDDPSTSPPPTTTTTFRREHRRGEEDSLEQVEADIAAVLKTLKADGQDPSLPKLFRNINMPSFTNLWSQKDWDLHTSRWRHLKYLWALPTSRLLRRLAPQLCALVAWSCIACWMCTKEFEGILSRAVLPLTPLGLVSTFIAGLLTLRSNQGLSRLNEGRLAFGQVVCYTRDMAQLITTVVYPRNKQLGLLAARHTSLFGWLLLDFLRNYDEDFTKPLDPYQPSVCHEEDVIRTMLPSRHQSNRQVQHDDDFSSTTAATTTTTTTSKDAQYLLDQRKKPVAICTRLRQIFACLRLELTSSEQSRLDVCAQQLNKCITVCERIRASPIPPLYTAHAGRLLIFYLFFLPLALPGSSLLNNVGTILTTTVVGYAMLGLDEISHILEQPFRLMPLYHLSKASMKDVADAVVCVPPSLPVDEEGGKQQQQSLMDDDDDYYLSTTSSSRFPSYW